MRVEFTADPISPTATTATVSNRATTTATCGGNVTADGGAAVTARGVCWNTTGTPTLSDDKTTDGTGTGTFSSSLTGLTPGTTYDVRAYATNGAGTAYGETKTFTTEADAAPEEADDETDVPAEVAPDLRVTIAASNQSAAVGEDLDFEVDVANVGTADATDVTLRFPLPAGTEFVGAWLVGDQASQSAPLEAYVEGDEIVVILGTVPTAQDVSIDLVLRATSSGAIKLQGAVACSEQPTPTTAQAFSDVEVDDVYYEVVQTVVPINACGLFAITSPLLLTFGLLAMKRRTRQS